MNAPTYGLVGRGRTATHIARYLELEGQRVISWHRGLPDPPAAVLGKTEIVLLAISDDALAPFIAENPELHDRRLVHFSGSLTIDGASGLHPLMTFGPTIYDLETYRSIPFVTERGGAEFAEIFPGFRNSSWAIEPRCKPLYHALCALAGNSVSILWSKAMEDFEGKLGLPREILRPYLERTATNSLEQGRLSLTGSLARNDRGTTARDLDALAGDPYRDVFLAITSAYAATEVKT